MSNVYVLGNVKPNVKAAANDAGNQFGVRTIYGVGARENASDHPLGLALDFMVYGNRAQGDSVAQFFFNNVGKYGVKYIIWKQQIWSKDRAGEGWRNMPDRGSVTANHFDHVHVSFYNVAVNNNAGGNQSIGTGGIPGPSDAINGIQELAAFFKFISDPHNWLRVAMFFAGMSLIVLSLIMVLSGSSSVRNAAKTVRSAI